MRLVFPIALVVACCVLSAPAPTVQAQAPVQPPQTLKFNTSATAIQVDVIVRKANRQFVGDLTAGDFEVYDDGIKQEVSSCYRVVGPSELDETPGKSGDTAVRRLPAEQAKRVLILYFDLAHIQPGGVDRAKKAATEFLKSGFRDGDMGGVLSGSTIINNHLTTSRTELESAIASITPNPESSELLRELREWPRFVDITEALRVDRRDRGQNPGPLALDDVVARACRERGDDCPNAEQQVQQKAAAVVGQARRLGRRTLDTVTTLTNGLSRLPGRKTVIMMSEGFFTEDSWADLRALVGQTACGNVRIYAVDTRGLNRGSASSDILTVANPSTPELSAPSTGDAYADGPNSLAVDTGGYVVRNEADFSKAFTEIDRDTSSYYVLGFQTSKPPDGRFHTLTVTVKRSGVAVRARKGYLLKPEATESAPSSDASEGRLQPTPQGNTPTVAQPPTGNAGGPPSAVTTERPQASTVTAPPAPAIGTTPLTAVRTKPRSAGEIERLGGSAITPGAPSPLPSDLAKKTAQGWEAYTRGDVETAKSELIDIARRRDAPPWVSYVLGWSHLALGEALPATTAWERVRATVPQFKPVYLDLANGYSRQGEQGKAVAVLREAEKRWPDDLDVYAGMGVMQLAGGALDEAVAAFEHAVALDAKDANAAFNLAKSLEMRYVRSARTNKISSGLGGAVASGAIDRDRAIALYRQVADLGGPLAAEAKAGLKRLGVD